MSYINFKEEKTKALKELEMRRENNYKLISYFNDHPKELKEFSSWEKCSYKTIKNESFGHEGIEDESSYYELCNKDILCTKFYKCSFNNIKFKGCKFIGCVFECCVFSKGGVIFDNCSFIKEDTNSLPSLNKYDNISCEFKRCKIYVKFLNCNMNFIIFDDCKIKNTNFEQSNMSNAIIINSDLKLIIIIDVNLTGIKVLKNYIEDIEFRDLGTSKLDEKSFFDKIPLRKKTKDEYEGLYAVYQSIANKFKENNLNNNFGEYYYICNNMKRKVIKPLPKLSSWIYLLSCGYGERPEYALLFSIACILIFAVIFLFTGIEVEGIMIGYKMNTLKYTSMLDFLKVYNGSVNASIGVFAGIGNDSLNVSQINYILESLEMALGIVMMGLGIGTLTRKIIR